MVRKMTREFKPQLRLEDQPHGAHWIAPVERRWGDWRVRVVFTEQRGHVVVQELHIKPASRKVLPDGGLTATALRALRLSVFQGEAKNFASYLSGLWDDIAPTAGTLIERSLDARPGRRGHPDRFYAELALAYEALVVAGEPAPIKRLAQKHHRSPARMRDLIHIARRKGFLTTARNGRAEGHATEKARAADKLRRSASP
jgi:hypothetical protein